MMESERLTLRKTELSDVDFVVDTETDSENKAYIGQWTYEEHVGALTHPDMLHVIIENKRGEQVGYMILTGLLDSNDAVCVKRIANKIKGNGYGKEALKLMVRWVFAKTATNRLWLNVKDFNDLARQIYESVGFVVEGTLRETLRKGDLYESLTVMSILRSEYLAHS